MRTTAMQAKIDRAVAASRLDEVHERPVATKERYVPADGNRPVPELETVHYVVSDGIHKIAPWQYLVAAGWLGWRTKSERSNRRPVVYLHPTEWVDLDSGEILNRSGASAHGIISMSVSERFLDARGILSKCREGVRTFIAFILGMRNQRGGLVADLDTLTDSWIENRTAIDPSNTARKRKALIDALYSEPILANCQTLKKNLQILGRPSKDDILSERKALISYFPVRGIKGAGLTKTDEFRHYSKAVTHA